MPTPMWIWCAAPGHQRATKVAVDINNFGDGYVHRSTRGLNPMRPEWRLTFPFTTLALLEEMDAFLQDHAVPGFWFRPNDSSVDLFVTCDEWSAAIIDRTGGGDMIGTLGATFERAYNPQPIYPTPFAVGAPVAWPMPPLGPVTTGPPVSALTNVPTLPPDGAMLPQPEVWPDQPVQPTEANR
jgi:phage-related protein